MTQIKKTLGIAGIIALVTMPVMADIASTAYVQSIVNNIPKPAAATASSAGLTKLYTGVGTNTDGTMTQAAIKTEIDTITNALNTKLEDNATDGSLAVGVGSSAVAYIDGDAVIFPSLAIGDFANAEFSAIAIGNGANASGASSDALTSPIAIGRNAFSGEIGLAIGESASASSGVAIGRSASSSYGVAIGDSAQVDENGIAIGEYAVSTKIGAVQLGTGTNSVSGTLNFGYMLADSEDGYFNYRLVNANGTIPAGRLTGQTNGVDNNGVNDQLLASDGNGGMKWVNAPSVPEGVLVNRSSGGGGIGIGENADGGSGVAIGNSSYAYDVSTAIGPGASASALNAVAIAGSASGDVSVAINGSASGESSIGILGSAGADGAIQLGDGSNNVPHSFNVGLADGTYDDMGDWRPSDPYPLLVSGGIIPYERFAPEIPNTCKAANNQTCALVIKWNSAQNKFTQSWEVVKIN